MRKSHRPAGSTVRLRLEALEVRDVPSATLVDLTTRGSAGEVNGAMFKQDDTQPTGSGVIHSFLRIQGAASKNVTQEGFNTDARPLQFDENKSPTFTHALHLGDVPEVFVNGAMYRVFLLDVNQKSSQPLLSLDQVRLYVGDAPNLTGYNASTHQLAGLDPVYDLDAGGDSWVKLDYRLNSGSGSGDMLMLVPESAFAGAGANSYVYLYSKFGEHFAGNAGFQEWAPGHGNGTGSISGTVNNALGGVVSNQIVYLDLNNNGVLDDSDVYTITDANGHYVFDNLPPSGDQQSVYYVRQVTQDGFTQTSSEIAAIFLQPGQDVTGVDFTDAPHVKPT